MKILVLSQYFWPQNYRINLITKELIKKKNEVIVLTSSCDQKISDNFSKIKIYRVKTYQIKKFKLIEIFFNYLTFYINATLFILINYKNLKADKIFIFQPSPIFIGLLGLLIKRLTKAKMYLWVLDLWPETVFDYKFINKSSFIGKVLSLITKKIYKGCEKIFIHCKSFESQIKKYTNKKCIFLPSPAEDIFQNSFKHKLSKKKIINILFAGNIGQSQSFDDIISSLSKNEFSNIYLTIIGNGRRVNDLKNLVKKNKNQNIIFKDRVSINKIKKFYKKTDFFFISLINLDTFKKTVPGKFQSYLRFGKPILGIINGETNKLIKKYSCGYAVNNGETKKLENILIKIKNITQTDYNKFCKNGINAYKKNYDKSLIINRLINNLK